jgi:phage baseplate assembly protein W
MAIEIKLHPLDFEPDVAIGVDLPMISGVGAAFKMNYTTLDQAVANAKNLLLTNRGERIMQPDFGCDLRKSLFENVTEELTVTLENTIRESFDYWLPYIFINKLVVTPYPDQNKITLLMEISLEGNQFDTRSIQLELTNTNG